MNSEELERLKQIINGLSEGEKREIYENLRPLFKIHEFEDVIGAPAEVILEAVHRAPELTRRMLRGVIADAAFRNFVVTPLSEEGWRDTTPEGNFAYDYSLSDELGDITVQVKLQRSESGVPLVHKGKKYGVNEDVYIVEPQKTRGGKDANMNDTRFYRYGEFDILAVSMFPSTGRWDQYMFIPQRWLIPGTRKGAQPGEIAVIQPVSMKPDEFWTDNFLVAAEWVRSDDDGKNMSQRMR